MAGVSWVCWCCGGPDAVVSCVFSALFHSPPTHLSLLEIECVPSTRTWVFCLHTASVFCKFPFKMSSQKVQTQWGEIFKMKPRFKTYWKTKNKRNKIWAVFLTVKNGLPGGKGLPLPCSELSEPAVSVLRGQNTWLCLLLCPHPNFALWTLNPIVRESFYEIL